MLKTLNQLAGFVIERHVLRQIQTRYAVVTTAAIKTNGRHGPRMEGGNHSGASLPDAQVFGKGLHGWLEVKAKSAPNLWKTTHRYEHGFNRGAIRHYHEVQAESDWPVNILVCESQTGLLKMATLDTLDTVGKPVVHQSDDVMIHYDVRAFQLVGTCDFPDGDINRMIIEWHWDALNSFLGQLAFEFATAEIRT